MNAEKKSFTVHIDAELCKGCGYCKELCPKQVYEFGKKFNTAGYRYMAVVAMENCIGCRTCMMVCPDFATHVEDNQSPLAQRYAAEDESSTIKTP